MITGTIVGAVALLAAPSIASAHAGLLQPPPRTTDSLIGAPCGQGEVTGPRTVFEPGQTIQVQWEQYISHLGIFRLAFSPNDDEGFDDNVLATVDDDPAQQLYELEITLPSCTCDDCTLQLYQTPGSGGYYSCADIELRAPEGMSVPQCPQASVGDPEGGTTGDTSDESGGGDEADVDTDEEMGGGTGLGGSDDDGTSDDEESEDGGETPASRSASGCAFGPRSGSPGWLLTLLLAPSVRRRRRVG
ncbi:MAG: lytic polysaccharide monooxygenase [Myxococcales bacterium]|nr:lytic polysaccharide monooxygenase [Myxococcales bacterium]MCB9719205.1 lytic polysaccharide monooxygenase [Myxococcales bacterium]